MSEETATGQEPTGLAGGAPASADTAATGSLSPTTSWKDTLEKEYQTDPTIQNIKAGNSIEALNALAKQAINAQRMIGVDRIPALKVGASSQERAEYRQEHFGVPTESSAYTFNDKIVLGQDENGVDVETVIPEHTIEAVRRMAASSGLDPEQASIMLNEFVTIEEQSRIASEEDAEKGQREGLAIFAQELGLDFKPTMDLAQDAYNRLVPETLQAKIPGSLLNDPEFIAMFSDFGKSLSDDTTRGGNIAGNDVYEPAQALRAIQDLEMTVDYKGLLAGTLDMLPAENLRTKRADLYRQAYPPQ
tara:strand:+ start:2283 stop:3194 length:912 start_codon:yes stop_codon:yes gene_type:complete